MKTLALITGLSAVFLYLVSFQFPKRRTIIACNVVSRVLYILQYLMLLAFEGAAMDISAIPSSLLAARKNRPFVQKHKVLILVAVNGFILLLGALVWQDRLSWIPIAGVLLETNAMWFTEEKHIRALSLTSLPFWLVYNISCQAYGSALGNLLAMVSIYSAIARFDLRKQKNP